MLTSPSSSYLDLRAPNAQRIKRKPPPTVDVAERYPSPDPSDPFAPLWVLRNRTSSALLDHVSPAFSCTGAHESQETLENPSERRRSVSYMNPSPLSQNASTIRTDARLASMSPSPSPSPNFKARPDPTEKTGHYMRYSQLHAASAPKLQAFPCIATPHASQTDVNITIASPKRTPGLYDPTRSSTPDDADLSDYCGVESDTASSTSEIRFRPNTSPLQRAASPSLAYPYPIAVGGPRSNLDWQHTAGSISTISNGNPKAESKLKLHSQPLAARVEPARLRFTKFLILKKRSSLLGSTTTTSNAKTSSSIRLGTTTVAQVVNVDERRRAPEPHKVHKASISAPQAVMSTVAWDQPSPPRNMPPHPQAPRIVQHQRSAGPMSTLKQGQDKENKKLAVAVSPGATLIRRSISLDVPTTLDSQKHLLIPTPSPWAHQQPNATSIGNLSTKPNLAERPPLISVNDNIDGVHPDHHGRQKPTHIQCESGTADPLPGSLAAQEQIKGHKLPSPRNDTPAPVPGQGRYFNRTLQPISDVIKRMERSTSPALQARLESVLKGKNGNTTRPRHSRMFSFPPMSLSPISPNAHSISGTSIVNISLPSSPTNFEWQHVEEEAYTSPRPAPTPPPLTDSPPPLAEKPKAKTLQKPPPPPAFCSVHPHSEAKAACCGPPGANPASIHPGEWAVPTEEQIRRAATLQLTCEDGTRVSFASLFAAHRTIVVFIRHFWCPMCQDYMASLKAHVQPEMLSRWTEAADVRGRLVSFVVISNGAHGMIRKYRRIFGLPFNVYTDPGLAVYKALGMRREGDDGHRHFQGQQQIPRPVMEKAAGAKEEKSKRSGYVKHGLMGGIAMVVVRAIKVGMPVWEKGGDVGQLGGEFIFGPGLTCSFAHRMQTTKGHAPIEDVLEAAGIDASSLAGRSGASGGEGEDLVSSLGSTPTTAAGRGGRRRHESMRTVRETLTMRRRSGAVKHPDERRFSSSGALMTREEEEEWMAERQRQIERLQERKNVRRGTSSRAASALSSYAQHDRDHEDAPLTPAILEAVGELSDEKAESEGRRESFDSSSEGGDTFEDEKTAEQESLLEEVQVPEARAPSMIETASCYSTPSGEDEDDRDLIFMDTENEDDSWKTEDERNILPTTSYLFIH